MKYKTCTLCNNLKSFSEYHKGKGYKDGIRSYCKSCAKEMNRKRYAEKKDHIAKVNAEWAKNNPEKRRKITQKYKAKNREKLNKKTREWFRKNPEKLRGYLAKRRAQRLNATPKWLSKEDLKRIDDIYTSAKVLGEKFKVNYHVDHIIPLNGENVCGLHVPWNLQLLEASLNIAKGNSCKKSKFW
jgi:hypothetical protein